MLQEIYINCTCIYDSQSHLQMFSGLAHLPLQTLFTGLCSCWWWSVSRILGERK